MRDAGRPTLERSFHQRRWATVLLAGLALAFGGLVVRLAYINTKMAPRLRRIAHAQQQSHSTIEARRGLILDVRGRVLAGSRQHDSVYADPSMIDRPDVVARALADALGMLAGEIENEIRSSDTPRFCWLKRRVDDEDAGDIRTLIQKEELRGVGLKSEFGRHWPMGERAAHVLGVVGADGRGLEGVELVLDDHLRGVPGHRSTLRDARRKVIGAGNDPSVPPRDGGHLMLTIDTVIQMMVEHRLRRQVREFRAESGVAVVMSPWTGEVLAMACEPTFEPARYRRFDASRRRNRTMTDPVEPGSTFKPFIAAGALQQGYVSTTEMIDCRKGLHYFGDRRIHDTSPHGRLDLRGIVVHSSNIGMGILGTRMGNKSLRDTVTAFGFDRTTQVGLPGESGGIVPPLRRWTSYSTTSVPMGQEIAVTPLQLANAFCAMVNGGYLLRPRLVRERLGCDGATLERRERPEVIRRVLSEEVAEYFAKAVLPGVVEKGLQALDTGHYTMCGKTGTAQVPYTDRLGYEPNAYLSSFLGAAPVSRPEIVVLVMIRKPDPSLGYYGRIVAGPVVRDIVRSALQYLSVPPDEAQVVSALE